MGTGAWIHTERWFEKVAFALCPLRRMELLGHLFPCVSSCTSTLFNPPYPAHSARIRSLKLAQKALAKCKCVCLFVFARRRRDPFLVQVTNEKENFPNQEPLLSNNTIKIKTIFLEYLGLL
jgi:hypothetical protein